MFPHLGFALFLFFSFVRFSWFYFFACSRSPSLHHYQTKHKSLVVVAVAEGAAESAQGVPDGDIGPYAANAELGV